MLRLYQREWDVFKKHYARIFLWVLGIGITFSILSYVVLVNEPDAALKTMDMLREQLQSQVERLGGDMDGSSLNLFLIILKNNLYASLLIFVLGFIPVVVLPFLSSFATFLSIGIMLAGIEVLGQNSLLALVTGILPHGIVEMTALVYATSLGISVSLAILKKVFSSQRDQIHLGASVWQATRSFLLVVVPFIIIAAAIEGFLTPMIMSLVY